jgi:hypothetical protein
MARALVIEEERGTCRGYLHQHNGYYAGDFSSPSRSRRPEPSGWPRHRIPRRAETTRPSLRPVPLAA